jgi:hypothetical protein
METVYSATEIVKRLKGVTTRQILDIAEKRLVKPARESTGPGSPRLYDRNNVFEICICLAVRGRLPAHVATNELVKNLIEVAKQRRSNLLLISYDDKDAYIFYEADYNDSFSMLKRVKKYRPQNFCTYTIEINALWAYIESIF